MQRPEGINESAPINKSFFFVPLESVKKEETMKKMGSYKYLVSVLFVLLISSIAMTPVLGQMQDPKVFIYKTGDESHPLKLLELLKERDTLIEEYKNSEGVKGVGIGGGDPMLPENATVMAYGFTFDENGVPHQMIAISGGEPDPVQIHQRADQWYNENILNSNINIADSVSDGLNALTDLGWSEVGADEGYYWVKPYGLVEHNWRMYRNTDETNPTKDYFAIRQMFTMDPGFRRWRDEGSKWVNERGLAYTDWDQINTFGNPALHDRDPLGTQTGPSTISVGLAPSPSYSWSFPLNVVTIYDQSDPVTKRAQWDFAFNLPEVLTTIQGWEPGSSASMDQHSSGFYYLAYLDVQGKFIDPTTWPNYQWVIIGYYWNTWFEYW